MTDTRTTLHNLAGGPEVAEVSPTEGGGWQGVIWSTRDDYDADQKEGGDWSDRATVSFTADTRAEILAELDITE